MTARRYNGHYKAGAGRDATYTLRRKGGRWQVMTQYRSSSGMELIEATDPHAELVDLVNRAKREAALGEGGTFVINEYGHVLVPTGEGAPICAGTYRTLVRFVHGGRTVSGRPGPTLRPGHEWTGPRAGIKYTLPVGARDIRRQTATSTGERVEHLSEFVGAAQASALAGYLALTTGTGGGSVLINEHGAFFAPPRQSGGTPVYLGSLADGPFAWFPAPAI